MLNNSEDFKGKVSSDAKMVNNAKTFQITRSILIN